MLTELRLTNIELVAQANIRAGYSTDVPELAAEIRRLWDGIRELHRPVTTPHSEHCASCLLDWPCPTAQLIEVAE